MFMVDVSLQGVKQSNPYVKMLDSRYDTTSHLGIIGLLF